MPPLQRLALLSALLIALPFALAAQDSIPPVTPLPPLQPAGADSAESIFERLGLDRLRLVSVGASYGVVKPTQVEPTQIFSVYADYGEIVPEWRVVFVVSAWRSRFTDAVVREFADSVGAAVNGASGGPSPDLGRIRASVLALSADARWAPRRASRISPYAGGSVGAYATDVEGAAISGTFVESRLDNISAGFAFMTGLTFRILPSIAVDAQARYDLLSGTRFSSLRTGGSYIFGTRRRTP